MGAGGWPGKLTDAGPELALLSGTYGWTPDQVAKLTPQQVRYYLEHMPDVALRQAWPLAGLEATLLNLMGGKPDSDAPPRDPSKVYTVLERLPWFARPAWLEEQAGGRIPAAAARDFLRHRKHVPSWALSVAPIGRIKAAAG